MILEPGRGEGSERRLGRLTQICNVSLGEVYIIMPWCHGDITLATQLSNISTIINNEQHFHITSLPKCLAVG